jgi:hypothetical protein
VTLYICVENIEAKYVQGRDEFPWQHKALSRRKAPSLWHDKDFMKKSCSRKKLRSMGQVSISIEDPPPRPPHSPEIPPLEFMYTHEICVLVNIHRNWSPEETYHGSDYDFVLTCSSKHGKGLNIDWTLFVLKRWPILRCSIVSLKHWEVDCKPQQVTFVYLNLLKNRVVLNPRWNFVDTLYICMFSFKSLCS